MHDGPEGFGPGIDAVGIICFWTKAVGIEAAGVGSYPKRPAQTGRITQAFLVASASTPSARLMLPDITTYSVTLHGLMDFDESAQLGDFTYASYLLCALEVISKSIISNLCSERHTHRNATYCVSSMTWPAFDSVPRIRPSNERFLSIGFVFSH